MYFQVASKLAVKTGVDAFSQAVSMAGGNAVYFDVTLFNKTGSSLNVMLQQGNDLENWGEIGGTVAFASTPAVGQSATLVTQIASAYVRLKYVQGGSSDISIVGAGINVANL